MTFALPEGRLNFSCHASLLQKGSLLAAFAVVIPIPKCRTWSVRGDVSEECGMCVMVDVTDMPIIRTVCLQLLFDP